jgi:hypothetical protein
MWKQVLITSFAIFSIASFLGDNRLNALDLPGKIKVGQSELALNGAGVRQKSFFKLYVAGLYLKNPSNDADSIINANEEMAIQIEITSGFVSQAKMAAALNEGFQNSTNGNTASLQKAIDQFQACFADEINTGDLFTIAYVPSQGVVVSKNGRQNGVVEGLAFKKALFGIWLGNKPADAGLKNALLSQ